MSSTELPKAPAQSAGVAAAEHGVRRLRSVPQLRAMRELRAWLAPRGCASRMDDYGNVVVSVRGSGIEYVIDRHGYVSYAHDGLTVDLTAR